MHEKEWVKRRQTYDVIAQASLEVKWSMDEKDGMRGGTSHHENAEACYFHVVLGARHGRCFDVALK